MKAGVQTSHTLEQRAESTDDFALRFRSVAAARRIAQPPQFSPSPTDPPYRLVSIFPSMILARLGVTANQVTIVSALMGIAGAVSIGWGTVRAGLLGAILLQLGYLLDFVDGEVARLQQRSSRRGYFLDLVSHSLIKTALFLGAGYGVFLNTQRPVFLWLAFIACVSTAGTQVLPVLGKVAGVTDRLPSNAPRSITQRLAVAPCYLFESPGLFALVLIGVVFQHMKVIVFGYGIVAPLYFLYRAWEYRFDVAQ